MQNFTLSFQEHRRTIILSSVTLVIVLALGVAYAMFGNPFATTTTPSTKIAPHTPPKVVDFSQRQNASSTAHYLLPRSKVTRVYASVYTNTANEATSLLRVYATEMVPLIVQAKVAAQSKDYTTLQSVGQRVRVVNDAQKIRLITLSGDFNNLAIANEGLSDPETKMLTANMISSGNTMVARYVALTKLIDNVLIGKVSSSTVEDATAISGGVGPATKAFLESAKKLGDYLTLSLKDDPAATSPVTTPTKP